MTFDERVVPHLVVTLMDCRVIETDARVTLDCRVVETDARVTLGVHRVGGTLLIGAPPKRDPPKTPPSARFR